MRVCMFSACGFIAAGLLASAALADEVTLSVTLSTPSGGAYRLAGQSAFVVLQTNSGTSGGQLDGVESPGATIVYTEVFPPPLISDYLTFSYFGLVQTLDAGGELVDTSLVVALEPGVGVGQTIGDLFPGLDEDILVAAFQTQDSPEFLDMLSTVPSASIAQGDIALPTIGRPGETLSLVAFTAGVDGDVGFEIGSLSNTTVPGPAGAWLVVTASAICFRRRR